MKFTDEDGVDGPFNRAMDKAMADGRKAEAARVHSCGCGFRGDQRGYDMHDCVRMTALAESRAETFERGGPVDCEECGEPTRNRVPALIGITKRPGSAAICKSCVDAHEHEAQGDVQCGGCGEWISDDGTAKFCAACAAENRVAEAEAKVDR